jgi:hypothetical protein
MDFDLELLLWGVLPAIVGVLLLWKSLTSAIKGKSLTGWTFSLLICAAVGVAEIILFMMVFENAWPSYLPYLLIGGSFILLGLQSLSKTA